MSDTAAAATNYSLSTMSCAGCGAPASSAASSAAAASPLSPLSGKGRVLQAFGMVWHGACLGCHTCGRDFFTAADPCLEGADGFAYCDICHADKFSVKCGGCGEGIVGGQSCLDAMGKKWHPEHFACGLCKKPFSGQFFPGDDGKPYCEQHYYEAMGMLCAGCEKPILTGKCITFLDKKYHPEHFKCTHCKENLVGHQYYKQNGKPYCKQDHLALFG